LKSTRRGNTQGGETSMKKSSGQTRLWKSGREKLLLKRKTQREGGEALYGNLLLIERQGRKRDQRKGKNGVG